MTDISLVAPFSCFFSNTAHIYEWLGLGHEEWATACGHNELGSLTLGFRMRSWPWVPSEQKKSNPTAHSCHVESLVERCVDFCQGEGVQRSGPVWAELNSLSRSGRITWDPHAFSTSRTEKYCLFSVRGRGRCGMLWHVVACGYVLEPQVTGTPFTG